jgi:phosphatidylglycerophosphate synthase
MVTSQASRVRVPAAGLGAQPAMLTLLWAAGVCVGVTGWLAGTAYAVVVWAALRAALRRSRARRFGPANGVTLARATLVGCVTAIVAQTLGEREPVTVLIVIAGVAMALDGVDGQVARRTGTVTPLGARFDMEVDAFLILVLSVFVGRSLGLWVVSIGAMRYAFVAAGWAFPWLRAPLPARRSSKAIAALQGVALLVAASGLLPPRVSAAVVAVALAFLTSSFARDVLRLWRTRHTPFLT